MRQSLAPLDPATVVPTTKRTSSHAHKTSLYGPASGSPVTTTTVHLTVGITSTVNDGGDDGGDDKGGGGEGRGMYVGRLW